MKQEKRQFQGISTAVILRNIMFSHFGLLLVSGAVAYLISLEWGFVTLGSGLISFEAFDRIISKNKSEEQ